MPQNNIDRSELPSIIQGGMGIGVSSWRLARTVAQHGELGVISGTAIDSVVARELQDGDPNGRRQVLQTYPDPEIVNHLLDRFYQPEGRSEQEPYDLLPIHQFTPRPKSQRILAAATYTEVRLAKTGHDGLVGMNLLAKLKRYSLPCLYGAMLANMFALPIADKLSLRSNEEQMNKNIIIESVLGIQEGQNPKILGEILKNFLPASKREQEEQQAVA